MEQFCNVDGFKKVFNLLEQAVEQDKLFTAWSVASGAWLASAFFADEWQPSGRIGAEWQLEPSRSDDCHPVFDLASLTKPLFVPLWLKISGVSLGALSITLREICRGSDYSSLLSNKYTSENPLWNVSVLQLINHAAGLKPWFWMGSGGWVPASHNASSGIAAARISGSADEDVRLWKRSLMQRIFQSTLSANGSNGQVCYPQSYSDIGYLLLSFMIETGFLSDFVSWKNVLAQINAACRSRFLHASLLDGDGVRLRSLPFFPYISFESASEKWAESLVAMQDFGSVHDTNANILAAVSQRAVGCERLVSGHAGLLGSILDLEKCLPLVARGHGRWLRESSDSDQSAKLFEADERFVLGLDTPSSELSAAGIKNFAGLTKGEVLGHLGYTGSAFWFHFSGKRHALLTNRTAVRKSYGSKVPRLAVVTSPQGDVICCGVKFDVWKEISLDEYLAIAREYCGARVLIWDESVLRNPADISVVRRSVGLASWDI